MAGDLSFGQALWLAGASGAIGFTTASTTGWLTRREGRRREGVDRADARRGERIAAYAAYLAAATGLDSRLDLYTPSPGKLGYLRSRSTWPRP